MTFYFQVGRVLEHSDPTVIFAFMLTFTIATISQCFLISVFFSRANLAAVCGGFIYFILYLPYTQLVQWEDYTDTSLKLFTVSKKKIVSFSCWFILHFLYFINLIKKSCYWKMYALLSGLMIDWSWLMGRMIIGYIDLLMMIDDNTVKVFQPFSSHCF